MPTSSSPVTCPALVRRRSAGVLLVLAVALSAVGASHADTSPSAPDAGRAATRAGAYLVDRQATDGSVPPGGRPDLVAEGLVALRAAGYDTAAVDRVRTFVVDHADEGSTTGPYTGRIVAALVASGVDPRAVDGVDLVARLASFHDPVSGSYGGANLYADALAMMGVLATGERLPAASMRRLQIHQCSTGGWSHREGCLSPADTDTTALVTAVLAVAAPDAAEVAEGRRWLLDARRDNGGWGADAAQSVNVNSTALAMQAVLTLGEDPAAAPWATPSGSPLTALLALQRADGAFPFLKAGKADDYATIQALPALAGWRWPLHAGQEPATRNTSGNASTPPAPAPAATVAAASQERPDRGDTALDAPSPSNSSGGDGEKSLGFAEPAQTTPPPGAVLAGSAPGGSRTGGTPTALAATAFAAFVVVGGALYRHWRRQPRPRPTQVAS